MVDVAGSPDRRFDGGVDPRVGLGRVFPREMHPTLVGEQGLREIRELVRGESSESSQRVLVQLPLVDDVVVAGEAQVLLAHLVDVGQVLEHHVHAFLVRQGQEELGVVVPGVGGQDDAHPAGEVVAGVVNEAGGAVGGGEPAADPVLLPELLGARQDDFGGAGVVDGAQGVGFGRGQRWQELDVPGGFGAGGDKDEICREHARGQRVRSAEKNPDFAALGHDLLHGAVEADDAGQCFVESSGKLVKPPGDFIKSAREEKGECKNRSSEAPSSRESGSRLESTRMFPVFGPAELSPLVREDVEIPQGGEEGEVKPRVLVQQITDHINSSSAQPPDLDQIFLEVSGEKTKPEVVTSLRAPLEPFLSVF